MESKTHMESLDLTLYQFVRIANGQLIKGDANDRIERINIDSRKFYAHSGTAFLAIKGVRHDGHAYLKQVYDKGGRIFIVSTLPDLSVYPDAAFILVNNVVSALHSIAAHHRSRFSFPVVAITGSTGKTIVKEWLYQLLSNSYHVVRSPKSYNSQIGVPLSLLLLNSTHTLAVIETGISHPGEMGYLQEIVKPDIGIFTNIGPAHQENFSDVSEKIREKLLLFKGAKTIYYCLDHTTIHEEIVKVKTDNQQLLSWSSQRPADLQITRIESSGGSSFISGRYAGQLKQISIPFADHAAVENACHLWLYLLSIGVDDDLICDRFSSLQPVAMRMEQLQAINGSILVNDAFNSDINSLEIALDLLKSQTKNSSYTAIVSDILQSGEEENRLYSKLSHLLTSKNIDEFIGIGSAIMRNRHLFKGITAEFYESTEAFLQKLNKADFAHRNILLKGARPFAFERIADILQEKTHQTILEIDLGRMRDNLNFVKSKLEPDTKIMVMVKAFAYGSGSYDVARLMEYYGVDYLAVAYADEGISLRENGIAMPIMVLNPELSSYAAIIRYNLEPQLYSFNAVENFSRALTKAQLVESYPVHIKINSGMNRLGFNPSEVKMLAKRLSDASNLLTVKSVFSHLAASDDIGSDDATKLQIAQFLEAVQFLEEELKYPFLKHILNSSGIFRHTDAQMDMVRVGLALYGISSTKDMRKYLKPVSRLSTKISQIRIVPKGEGVGYNPSQKVVQDTRIAILPIGYADGLPRLLGNGIGGVYLGHQRVPFIGNICMDMSMVDIGRIPCEEGDSVEVFGDNIPLYELANQLKTIPYEVLTNISQRVKRVFIHD